MARIEWTQGTIEDLEKLDMAIARRILRMLTWFSKNSQSIVPEPLIGKLKGTFRLRIGDWRAVHTVEGVTALKFLGCELDLVTGGSSTYKSNDL